MLVLAVFVLLCSIVPAAMFVFNLKEYIEPAGTRTEGLLSVSVLIPARNEAHAIRDAILAVLASRGVDFELIVMDDGSTDGTAEIVREMAAGDPRLHLQSTPSLPAGWNGKQHACWALAQAARNPVLCFIDADVRVEPDCIARMTHLLQAGNHGLVSGFPRQVTKTFLEWMLLPLIHFVLLGFLPLRRMRSSTSPAFAAGCGQFMMVRTESYFACGGHSGIKLTMHDGLRLPRLFREAGFKTDLADLTRLAHCRMYTSAPQVWSGLAKNATEGLGAPARIVPITILLLAGQVLPFLLLSQLQHSPLFDACIVLAVIAAWAPRVLGMRRFQQDWRGALLHPLGILLLITLQWYALLRKIMGSPVSWKDRAYSDEQAPT